MPTAFRQTAILPDPSGRFRTSVVLAWRKAPGHTWSDSAIAEHVARNQLPCKGLELSDSEYDRLQADSSLRYGYVDAAGDLESPFVPTPWVSF